MLVQDSPPERYLPVSGKNILFFSIVIILFISLILPVAASGIARPIPGWSFTHDSGTRVGDQNRAILATSDGGFTTIGSSFIAGLPTGYAYKIDQNGNLSWTSRFFGWAGGADVTSDGGYFLSGTSGILSKISPTGNIEWTKDLKGDIDLRFYSSQETLDGGYILAGQSYTTNNGIVVKVNNNGEVLDYRDFNFAPYQAFCDIRQTSEGGYIVVGYQGFGSVGSNEWTFDGWVVKLDSNLNIEWQHLFSPTSGVYYQDFLLSVRETRDHGFIAIGETGYIGGDDWRNIWVLKLNPDGSTAWQRMYGGSEVERAASIFETPDDKYIFAGTTHSNDVDVFGNHGYGDIWVVKINQTGDIIWQKCFGDANMNWAGQVSDIGDESVYGSNGNDDYRGGYQVIAQNAFFNYLVSGSTYQFGGNTDFYTFMFTDVIDPPFIEKIIPSPYVPVTGKKMQLGAEINESPFWEITGIKWEMYTINSGIEQLVDEKGSSEEVINPYEYTTPEAQYGKKRVVCTLYGKHLPTGRNFTCDSKDLQFSVFFPMVIDGEENWELKDADKGPVRWACDSSNAWVGGAQEPNWYRYWKKDEAVINMNLFQYDPNEGAGAVTGEKFLLGPQAPQYWLPLSIATGLEPTGETLSGTKGILGVSDTIAHELRHREIELAWMPGNPFYNQTDSDRISNCDDQLPDDFENGTLTTFWEPRGSLTNKTNTDTYEMAYRTRYPDYSTYGDQEYLCYRAGKLFREDWKDDNKDWSDYGVLAKEQKKSFEKQFDSFSSVALLKEQPDQLIAKEDLHEPDLYSGLSGLDGSFIETAIDNNGNGLFDSLSIETGIKVNSSSQYSVLGWLYDNSGNDIAFARNSMYFEPGNYSLPLNFSATTIHSNGVNGPYNLTVALKWGSKETSEIDRRELTYTTQPYSLNQFEGSQIGAFTNFSDFGIDHNGDGIFEYLQVTHDCQVNTSGNYLFRASLYKDDQFLTSAEATGTVPTGVQTIDLLFPGLPIGSHQTNGPYSVRDMSIWNEEGDVLYYDADAYTTAAYQSTQFLSDSLSIWSLSDHGSDLNRDGRYEFLTVNVSVNVTDTGNYTISSYLLDPEGNEIVQSYEELYLTAGLQVIGLDFDGREINRLMANGPYTIPFVKVEDENWDTVAIKAPAHITGPYQYTQFQGLLVNMTGEHADAGIDSDGNGLFEVLSVDFTLSSEDAGEYSIRANLVSPDGSIIDWDQTNATFAANETKPVRFQFDGTKISDLQKSGSFTIEDLVIYEEASYDTFAVSPAFSTSPYLSTQFEKYGTVTGNITSVFGPPLQNVQVKIEGKNSNLTDVNGSYVLKVFPGGMYEVRASPPSYYNLTPESATVLVIPGSETIQDFILHSDGSLAPVILNITPLGGDPGEVTPFTIHGENFRVGLQVLLNRTGDLDHLAAVFNTTPGRIQGNVNLTGIGQGVWNVIVKNPDGQVSVLEDGFRVYNLSIPKPNANFTTNVSSGIAPLAIQFTDLSTGNPFSWHWDFGDGNTSDEQNPVHVYSDPGTASGYSWQYVVSLTVENDGGSSLYDTVISVSSPSIAPVANFTPVQFSWYANIPVQFLDKSENSPTSWYWDFGDGSNSTERDPMHTYSLPGNYTVSLTATNNAGSDTLTRIDCINVTWHSPEISYIAPAKGAQGSEIDLYISGMYFREGAIARLERDSAVIAISVTDIGPYGLYGTLSIPSDATLGDWNVTIRQDDLMSNTNVVFSVELPVPEQPGWMFRADERHSGVFSNGSHIPNNALKWSFVTDGPVQSSPVLVNGIVYFGSNDDRIYALYATNGTQKWSYTTGADVRSTPAIVNNRVFVGSNDGKVYALNAATGSPLWNVTTGNSVRSSPLVINNVVYIGSDDGKLYALNATTGSPKWSYTTGGPVSSSPAFNQTYLDWIFVGSNDGHLYIFNAANGDVVSTSYPSTGGAVQSSPAIRNQASQFTGSDDGWLWETMGPEGIRPAFFLGSPVRSSPAVFQVPDPIFPDRLVIGCDDGNISAFRLFPPFGPPPVLIWKYPTGGPVQSSPAIAHNTIYIGSNDGSVHAINASTGQGVWTYATGGPVTSSPIVGDGVVYVGSDDGTLYAIGNDTPEIPAPIVTGITPNAGTVDTVVHISNLEGLHFQENAQVNLTRTGYPNVTMTGVIVNPAGTSITGELNLISVPEGLWNVVVTNPGGKSGILYQAFSAIKPQHPLSSFVTNTTSGQAPLTVQFNDTSIGNPTTWNWSFGDGSWFNTTESVLRNATKTYLNPGSYPVQLTVTNNGGSDTSLPGATIIVTEPPVEPIAAFTTTIDHLAVKFIDQSTGSPPLTYAWDFGDGATTDIPSPSHTYSITGNYTVTLTVSNSAGSDVETQLVILSPDSSSIMLVSPHGGEQWKQGSTQTLRWNYTGDPGSSVKIDALRGTNVLATVATSYPIGSGGSGSYNLTFPYGTPLGSDYFIRLTSTGNAIYNDTNDAPFTIVPPITVVTPNGDEEWQQGSTGIISWNYIGDPGPTVKIEVLKGDTVLATITSSAPVGSAGTGSLPLALPLNAPLGNDFRIRISSANNPIYTDTSDAPFKIIANASSSIRVVSPDGGENYLQGSNQTIRWTYYGNPGSLVKIEALRNGTVLAVITPGTSIGSGGSGSFNLTFPYNTPLGSEYRIRVSSTSNPAWTDTSDSPFTIIPAITVATPNGGENYPIGSTLPMRWTYFGNPGSTVNIQVIKGTTVLKTLTGIPIGSGGSGSLNVTIPASTPTGSVYTIRVASASYPACFDASNGTFTIGSPG